MADSLLPGDNQPSPEDRAAIIAKWKDKPQDELLNAKAESDLYIKTLTSRLDDLKNDYLRLRDEHQASNDFKTLIDQFKKQSENPDPSHTTPREPVNQSLKSEDVEAIVQKRITEGLTAHQRTLKQQENFNYVQAKLKEQFGAEYQNAYKQRLDTLQLDKEFADDLAKNHPAVFLKTFELDRISQPTNNAPPRSQQRPSSFAPATTKRDWNYYQELKKNDPRMYLDPKIAIQMHNDAIELGDAFGMPQD